MNPCEQWHLRTRIQQNVALATPLAISHLGNYYIIGLFQSVLYRGGAWTCDQPACAVYAHLHTHASPATFQIRLLGDTPPHPTSRAPPASSLALDDHDNGAYSIRR